MITDNGFSMCTLGFLELQEALSAVSAIYRTDNWHVTPGTVTTNLPINTSCRAPGTPGYPSRAAYGWREASTVAGQSLIR